MKKLLALLMIWLLLPSCWRGRSVYHAGWFADFVGRRWTEMSADCHENRTFRKQLLAECGHIGTQIQLNLPETLLP